VILILGLETSCDETAAAVVADGKRVLSHVVAGQHQLHERYGGVVPEIASRAHLQCLTQVVEQALSDADVSIKHIDAIAVGNCPGLIGSLIVGVGAAKALAWTTGKPLIGVNHVHAHLYAAALHNNDNQPSPPTWPALGLVVSGGHTSMYDLQSPLDMHLLGRTIDDAVGEAYDKAAVILQLGYPGGPNLDQLAQSPNADPTAYKLPRSLLDKSSLNFSFSGLKTALLYTVRGKPQGRGKATTFPRSADDLTDKQRTDLAASFQAAVVDTLLIKLQRAVDFLTTQGRPPQSLIIGGGVSANSLLRSAIKPFAEKNNMTAHLPDLSYCLDNAAMIAGLAHQLFQANRLNNLHLPAIPTAAC
jgi:N6-L-threonylcarbamoyladenine synthase